jgi:hypothetical protein
VLTGVTVSAGKVWEEAMTMAEAKNCAPKQPWMIVVREQQQFFYEAFGDRDWDCYKRGEEEYLERNLGHAIFGPLEELPDRSKNGCTGNVGRYLFSGLC